MSNSIVIRKDLLVSSTMTPQASTSGYTGDGLPVISIPHNTNMFLHIVTENDISTRRICQHCEMVYDMSIPGTLSFGIPVKLELIESKEGIVKKYTVVGTCNTLNCAYSVYKKNYSGNGIVYRDALYQDSESLFKMMSYDLTGSTEIVEALPVSFLQFKGGKYTPEQYFKAINLNSYTPIGISEVKQAVQQYLRT